MVSLYADKYQCINPEHLSEIWHININTTTKTRGITAQCSEGKYNSKLFRNYENNDRMFRCKQLGDYFFMDTLFVTRKVSKSSRGDARVFNYLSTTKDLYIL